MTIKKILSAVITLAMVAGIMVLPVSAATDPVELDLAAGSVIITQSGYTQGEGAAETAHTGAYTITAAVGNANTVKVESGEISMTINGLNIAATASAAIRIECGAKLHLTVNGENTLKGAPGYAGISVAAAWDDITGEYDPANSGKLAITAESTGTLNVTGGDSYTTAGSDHGIGGGAGIGGDGFGESNYDGGDFGVVEIAGGIVNATGGKSVEYNGIYRGAGAGIGGGGIDGEYVDYDGDGYRDTWAYSGIINISSGTVTAIGGAGLNDNCGAAGIGAGAAISDGGSTSCATLPITITGGKVTAKGTDCAAGIGGSVNGVSGNITIEGGTIEAVGDGVTDGEAYGGAGIGSGDSAGGCGNSVIAIRGTANVTATGGGAAAGIGGGFLGYSDLITIEGGASVTAYGGPVGGAGIGTGGMGEFGGDRIPTVLLNTTGNIVAYGGTNAQGIGFGASPAGTITNTVKVGENNTGKVFAFTKGTRQSAIYGLNTDNTVDEGVLTLAGSSALYWNGADSSAWFKYGTASDNATHTWSASGNTLTLTCGETEVASYTYLPERFDAASNWAVIQNETDYLTPSLSFTDVTTNADRDNGVVRFDLVLEAASFDMVKNLVSGEFTTKLETIADGPFEYTVEPFSNEMELYYDTNADGTRKYHISLKEFIGEGLTGASYTTTDDSDAYADGIHLGVMTVSGFGKGRITVSENDLLMEKHDDTAASLKKTVPAKVGNPAEFNTIPPTCTLTVNIKFNNAVKNNEASYQNMHLKISGGKLPEDIVYDLGTDAPANVQWADNQYTISLSLKRNNIYSIKVTGAGYRTAYYPVRLTGDKTLNFWNNVLDTPEVIEVGVTDAEEKVTNNFLAGDIIDDDKINIYDLSAVVSYFGSAANVENGFAKYDLNRDGFIDSMDVAYVLASWNE